MVRYLESEVVSRHALAAGESGAVLERVGLADGRTVVVKRMRRDADWQMRATRDPGVRDALVYTSGLLDQLPTGVGHAILAVVEHDEGGEIEIVMRDVATGLIAEGRCIDAEETVRILGAATQMHRELRHATCAGLCSLDDRYRLLSPGAVAKEQDGPSPIPLFVLDGWRKFADTAGTKFAGVIGGIHDEPLSFTDALRGCGTTLIHGDLHLANVSLLRDEVVFLDWGLLTTFAPPAVEFAYFLAMRAHHASVPLTREQLMAEYLALAPETSQRELRLALLGSVVMFGWALALGATMGPSGKEELDWWLTQAELGLGEL